MNPEILDQLALAADGDARRALTLLEIAVAMCEPPVLIDESVLRAVTRESFRRFDKGGDYFL